MVLRRKSQSAGLGVWTVTQLGDFYGKNRVELHSHANRILKDSSLADEVTQDALVKVLLASPELESPDHAIAYMHRTIENLCIDVFRREGRRPNLVALDEVSLEIESAWQSNSEWADKISAAEDAAIVRDALSLLSNSERAALVMWELEGRSSKEIALELGIKESTVRFTLARARKALRRILAERVIDDSNGLTALDLLSKSYKKSTEIARKSSRAVFSIFLLLFAIIGFNAIPGNDSVLRIDDAQVSPEEMVSKSSASLKEDSEPNVISEEESSVLVEQQKKYRVENAKSTVLWFQGLDNSGVPTGFTIADSNGGFGSAYFSERAPLLTETDLTIGQIIKTETGASNVLISQAFTTDSSGMVYRPVVSFGQDGKWVPLKVKVVSTEIVRQMSGNYLFTAYIAVDSAIDSPIKIAASANGRDLAVAPKQVITRIVLDPSKTQVLNQAIFVAERGTRS